MNCILCSSNDIEILRNGVYEAYATGNRRIFMSESGYIRKAICRRCGHIQHMRNSIYENGVKEVFQNYGALHNKTFSTEGYISREKTVIGKIIKAIKLSDNGKMLDIGCGSGEALGYFYEHKPDWELYGMDIGAEFRDSVLSHSNVKDFFSTMQDVLDSNLKFDLITVNYVFSVADNPAEILETAKKVLSDDGILFMIDVDYEIHPYMLQVIENSSFLYKKYFENICMCYGFELLNVDFEHEPKEIWIFAKKKTDDVAYQNFYKVNKQIYENSIQYLDKVAKRAIDITKKRDAIGIMGMSCAGIWLEEILRKYASLESKHMTWIEDDEEVLAKGTGVNGYPIKHIREVNKQMTVFLPFPLYIADRIKESLGKRYPDIEFIV